MPAWFPVLLEALGVAPLALLASASRDPAFDATLVRLEGLRNLNPKMARAVSEMFLQTLEAVRLAAEEDEQRAITLLSELGNDLARFTGRVTMELRAGS